MKTLNIFAPLALFTVIFIASNGIVLACIGRIIMPPPNPQGEIKWNRNDAVVYGVVNAVETHTELTWIEKTLINLGIVSPPEIGDTTPPHRVTLKDVKFLVGSGDLRVIDLDGCGLPIPKQGQRALFFLSGKGNAVVPLYESDGDLFNQWINRLDK